jgi:predicted NAD-dependent protein-ADP-ribosyltransferase YbiA (DUF1768 family)
MSRHAVTFQDLEFKTAEHLFHWLRFTDLAIKEEIRAANNGFAAKLVAKKHAEKMVIQPRSDQDLRNMDMVVKLKLEQHTELQKQLLETGEEIIIEDVTKRGGGGNNLFWGMMLKDGKWVGENALGLIWMKNRKELKKSLEVSVDSPSV